MVYFCVLSGAFGLFDSRFGRGVSYSMSNYLFFSAFVNCIFNCMSFGLLLCSAAGPPKRWLLTIYLGLRGGALFVLFYDV